MSLKSLNDNKFIIFDEYENKLPIKQDLEISQNFIKKVNLTNNESQNRRLPSEESSKSLFEPSNRKNGTLPSKNNSISLIKIQNECFNQSQNSLLSQINVITPTNSNSPISTEILPNNLETSFQKNKDKSHIVNFFEKIGLLDKQISLEICNSIICKICQTNTIKEKLISPCNCKGSLAYVHLSCLERWLNQVSHSYCELCMYQFNSVQSQRYGIFESIRIWMRHPRNRSNVQSDILICLLLTIVTIGFSIVTILGMRYFIIEGERNGISPIWTKGLVFLFLFVIINGYLITLYLMIKEEFLPWYRWWRNTVNVRLVLSNSNDSISITNC